MKALFILLGLIFTATSMLGQNRGDYKQLLKKEISVIDMQERMDEFIQDFQTLIYFEFDSIDFEVFMGPTRNMPFVFQYVAASSLNALNDKEEKITFKDLRDILKTLIKENEGEYLKVRKIVEAKNEIVQRKATLQNWRADKQLLLQMGFTEDHILGIHEIVRNNERKPYSDILIIYADTLTLREERQRLNEEKKDAEMKKNQPGIQEWIGGLYAYMDYELGLSRSKEIKKPVLLYFNGHGDVNSRMIENDILLNPDIQDYINHHLIVVCLYVDERTKLNENERYFSEVLNREVIYTGQVKLELEMKQFNSNRQPLFVLLDLNGNEIARIGYTKEINEFRSFLETSKK